MPDREMPVDLLARAHARHDRVSPDRQAVELLPQPVQRLCVCRDRWGGAAAELLPARVGETERTVGRELAAGAVLVQRPLVIGARLRQGAQPRPAAVPPAAVVEAAEAALL